MLRHAAEHAGTPQRSIGVDEQRRVAPGAQQRRRAGAVITGDLRHGVPRPRTLPRAGLPCLQIRLALVLTGFLLVFVVWNVKARSADASDYRERVRRRREP